MAKTQQPKDLAFYCDVCERAFRIRNDHPGASGKNFTVACPTCGRKARVERISDREIRIAHKEHVLICPRPLNNNPLAVVLVYSFSVAVIALAFAAVTRLVHWAICPLVFFASLLVIGQLGAVQLSMAGQLNNNYVELTRIFYKGLPNLLKWRPRKGNVIPE